MKVQQLICDKCKVVLLEKDSKHLDDERFPITDEEAKIIDKEHRGHECHIELVEKFFMKLMIKKCYPSEPLFLYLFRLLT